MKNKLLLVEDEALIALSEKMELEKYGYDVTIVMSGEKAIIFVAENNDIDLILIDINLNNELDGTDAAEIILQNHDIPVVFLSSHTDPETVKKTEKITSYGYVVKSSSITVLDASIKMAFKLHDANKMLAEELTTRKQIEEEYENIFHLSPDMVAVLTTDGKLLKVNLAWERVLGYTHKELLDLSWNKLVHPDDVEKTNEEVEKLLKGNSAVNFINRYRCKDGSYRTLEWQTTFAKEGIVHSTARDITERKRVEEELKLQLLEKEIILKEVHHRIKNNFATIGSIIEIQAGNTTNPEALSILQDTLGRVNSMTVLYEKLLLTDDFKETSTKQYLTNLIDELIKFFPKTPNITIEKDIDDFQLDPKQLIPIGIIVNELFTNIFKYAFDKNSVGLIQIILKKEERKITLIVNDNGKGLLNTENKEGFGLMLVKLYSKQLGGTFKIYNGSGTKCTFTFNM